MPTLVQILLIIIFGLSLDSASTLAKEISPTSHFFAEAELEEAKSKLLEKTATQSFLGYQESSLWARYSLDPHPSERYLSIKNPLYETIELFLGKERLKPVAVFPFYTFLIPPGSHELYLRAKSSLIIYPNLEVHDLKGFFTFHSFHSLIIGGKGSVGQKAVRIFLSEGREIHVVDQGDQLPAHLYNREAILIDIARKGVLKSYADGFWEGLVIINETYPEPPKEVINFLKEKNIPLYHIAGVKAVALPRFPHAYAGGVPCCAMNPTKKVKPLVKALH